MKKSESYGTCTIRVETTDGTMWVHIMEDKDGRPFKIIVSAGKCGSSFSAWASAFVHLISIFLEEGYPITRLISEISGFSTDKVVKTGTERTIIRSGPEGIRYAISSYLADVGQKLVREGRENERSRERLHITAV